MAKLAFVLPNLVGGGAERVALTLIESFVARGHSVDLVVMRAEGELLSAVPDGVELVDLRATRLRNAVRPLAGYLRLRRPDAIQISMWPLTVIGVIAHRLAASRSRLMLSDHAILSVQYAASRSALALLRATARLFYPLADVRICVSHRAADDLAALTGMPRASIDVVYNPIAGPPPLVRTGSEIDRLWGDAKHRILSVGALKPEKDYALLIESFAKLPKLADAKLVIMGEGAERARLEPLVRRLGVADRVALPGFAANLWPVYESASLFVLSSVYEGFGNVIVEAMHVGLPIVSTDSGGPGEILGDGEYGILVPVGDAGRLSAAMSAALAQPEAPERQRKRAKDFSVQRAADEYLRLALSDDLRRAPGLSAHS